VPTLRLAGSDKAGRLGIASPVGPAERAGRGFHNANRRLTLEGEFPRGRVIQLGGAVGGNYGGGSVT
jgi:hypothetical protein